MRAHRPAKPRNWSRLTWLRYLFLGSVAGLLVAGLLIGAAACGEAATATPAPVLSTTPGITEELSAGPIVRVGQVDFPVELAIKSEDRYKGLSGRVSLGDGTGMLFVFEEDAKFRFWMKEMQISLDMVWIGSNCRVVSISENVPAPDPATALDDLPRYSPDAPARYVLEINGGNSAALGLTAGDPVAFLGELAGKYGC